MTPPIRPETEAERLRRQLQALTAARDGIPIRDPRPLPPVTITAPRAHPWVESMTRAQNPDLVAGQPPLDPQLTMRDLAADMAVQPFAASANMVTRFGEGAARTVGADKTADALRDRRRLINELTAPSTGMGLGTRVVSDLGASALPYIASGAGALGLLRSAGLTALESRSDDGSLVKGMADLTGSDALKRLADSPYRTPTDVGMDVAFNVIPGAKPIARTLMQGVPEATQGLKGPQRVARSLQQVMGNAARETVGAVRQNPGTALATAAAIAGDAVAPGAGTMLAAAAPVVGRPAFTETLYSRLGRAIDEAPFEKGTPQQWKALISKGVAAGEREFTGIEDFLNSSTAKTLTKQEVQQAFENGRIKLGEKMASDNLDMARDALDDRIAARREAIEARFNLEELGNRWNRANQDFDRASEGGARIALQEERAVKEAQDAWEEARRLRDRAMGADLELQNLINERQNLRLTKFRRYTQPGLPENYREVVLTLDNRVAPAQADEYAALQAEREAIFDRNKPPEGWAVGDDDWWPTEERARLDAVNRRLKEINPSYFGSDFDPNVFRARSHWDNIENPLLHLRLTDRATAGGERTLFVEELQSDWHQQGRERGYRPRDGSPPQYEGDLDRLVGADERVPDAPFKKTQEWVELGLKRALDEAVKGGYDRVAFVTGQQAADNFKLTRRIGTVYWNRSATEGAVDLIDAETGTPFAEAVPVGKLRGMLGDETAASKIQQAFEEGNQRGRLTDVNVKVGGEGMREFYDRIVPNTIRDYAKTLGVNIELEPTSMKNGSRNLSFRITPEVRDRVSLGQRLMSPLLTAGSTAAAGGAFSDEENRGQMMLAGGFVGVTGGKAGKAGRQLARGAAVASRPARGVAEILASGAAPAARVVDDWKPTSRGIFNREGLQDMQGTVASDARLVPPVGPRATSSMLTDAITTSPQVRAGLRADAERGLRMGGDRWYDLAPIRRYMEERRTPEMMSFEDFNRVGAGASMQNSVPSEISASSILNFARKRGLPLDEAKQIFLRETGTDLLPMLTGMHRSVGEKAIDAGALLPENPFGANWKVPMYADKRLGGGGTLDVDAPGALPALDTHEKRRILQLARQDPQVAKFMQELGIFDEDHVPVLNSADYRELGGMYVDAAREMGLPTAGTFQAGRWVGGWNQTGLKSPPYGDFTQILEDLITYSAQQRGMPSDPASLRSYFDRVLQGDDFIVPFTGRGAIPVRPQGR